MFRNLLTVCMFLNTFSFISFDESGDITEPITITGNLDMPELNEKIPLYLQMAEGHPYAYVDINIYVNNVLEVTERTITKYINEKPYYLNGFNSPNESKVIKVNVAYSGLDIQFTQCQFTLKSPHYETYTSVGVDSYSLKDSNPVTIKFSMKGGSFTITKIYEKVILAGKSNYNLVDSRMIDFSPYSITFYNITPTTDTCELRLYCEFEGSDLLYKNGYTSIDINLRKYSDYKYILKNEYKYYIDKKTGMIFENQTENCDDEMMPFFIPLSMGINKSIPYEIVFSDFGHNHNDYIFKGTFNLSSDSVIDENPQFGSVLNYKYVEKKPMENIDYA